MATPLPRTDAQREYPNKFAAAWVSLTLPPFRRVPHKVDRSPVSLRDCGRLAQDVILGVLCGVGTGLFAAIAVGSL